MVPVMEMSLDSKRRPRAMLSAGPEVTKVEESDENEWAVREHR